MIYFFVYLFVAILFEVVILIHSQEKRPLVVFVFSFFWPITVSILLWLYLRSVEYSGKCAYCGDVLSETSAEKRDAEVKKHVMVCAKHPMRQEFERLKKENDYLRREINRYDSQAD